jgi:DNA adenine methylase
MTVSTLTIPPRPFLKWAGGKSRLLLQYQPYLPENITTYYEPFLGGGALFFHLQQRQFPTAGEPPSGLAPQHAILSDINPELVNVYTCVRDQVEAVIQRLAYHATHHNTEYYYQVRATVPRDAVQRAARLIYLNKTCFNGLYRVNAQGQFNVPIGRYKNPKICDPDLLRSAAKALANTTILEQHFSHILTQAPSPTDFVYLDPPYHPLSATSNFTNYSHQAFDAAQQVQLRDVFAQLAARGVRVMQSNSDCPFIRDLYQGFSIHPITAARAINANPQKRGKITEVLIMS